MVETEEIRENFLVYFGASGGLGVLWRERGAGAGFGVEGGPIFGPVSCGGKAAGLDGLVHFLSFRT
jgi:hypothetical protein